MCSSQLEETANINRVSGAEGKEPKKDKHVVEASNEEDH
jgi:hypothetical protein